MVLALASKLSINLVRARCYVFGRAHRGSTVVFLLLQRFSVGLAVEYSSWFISVIYMFAVLKRWWVRSPSRGPNNLYVHEPQQNIWRGCEHVKRFKPPVIYYCPFQGGASVVVYLKVNVRPLSVCLWRCSFYYEQPGGHQLGKSCPLRFLLLLFLFCVVSVVCMCFPFPLASGVGCGIRLYLFLIFAFSSTFQHTIHTRIDPARLRH